MTTLNPALKVEIAFGPNPFASSLVFTDVSQYVILDGGVPAITVKSGRNMERNANEPGRLTGLSLLNVDGRFDSMNSASPYAPYLLPLRPIRVSATDTYSVADGATTNTATLISSATAFFSTAMVGYSVTGTGVPGGATIASIPTTTITAGSNGLSLPQGTINVASTAGFATAGKITVVTANGVQTVSYTGVTGTTFTGCTGGTGAMSTGGAVSTNTQATLSAAATATGTGVSLTFAKTFGVYFGYITNWPQSWQLDGTGGIVTLSAVDALSAIFGITFGTPYDTYVQTDLGINGDPNSSWGYWTNDTLAAGVLTAAETGWMSASGTSATPLNTTSGSSATIITGKSTNAVQFTAGGAALSLAGTQQSACAAGEALIRLDATPAPLAGTFEWLMCSGNSNTGLTGAAKFMQIPPLGDHVTPFITGGTAGNKPTVQAGYGPSIGWWKPPVNMFPSVNVSSFGTDATGWTRLDGPNTTLSRDTGQTQPQGGSATSGKLHGFANSTAWGIVTASFLTGITAGNTYAVTCRGARGANPDLACVMQIDWYNTAGTLLSSTISGAQTIHTQSASNYFWSNVVNGDVAPATAVKCKVSVKSSASSSLASGTDVWFTDFMLVDVTALNTALSGLPGPPTATGATPFAWAAPGDTNIYFFMTTPGVNVNTDNAYSVITTSLPAITVGQWYVLTWATPNITGSAGTAFVRFTPVGGGTNVDLFGLLTNTYNRTVSTNVGNLSWGGATSDLHFTLDDFYLARWNYTSTTAPNVVNPNTTSAAAHAVYVSTAKTFPAQLTGARINGVLDAMNFPTGQRNIDAGLSTIIASGSLVGTAALAVLNAAAAAELGNVWADPAGTVQFRDRSKRNNATVTAVFGELDAEVSYADDLSIDRDYLLIYNDIEITQQGATPTYVAVAQDPTSIGTSGTGPAYGPRTLTSSVPLATQADVNGMAATLLAWYKDSRPRLSHIRLRGRTNVGRRRIPQMLGRSIGDLVTANKRPDGAPMISLNSFIDGIEHSISRDDWATVFTTTPQFPNTTY